MDISNAIKSFTVDKYEHFGKYLSSELKSIGEPNATSLMENPQVEIINFKRPMRNN